MLEEKDPESQVRQKQHRDRPIHQMASERSEVAMKQSFNGQLCDKFPGRVNQRLDLVFVEISKDVVWVEKRTARRWLSYRDTSLLRSCEHDRLAVLVLEEGRRVSLLCRECYAVKRLELAMKGLSDRSLKTILL